MAVSAHRADGFEDPLLTRARWEALLSIGPTDCVFLTRTWQMAWWRHFGRGDLVLIAGLRDGRTVAVAPLFSESGMGFLVGSGGSDYLDFVGDAADPRVLCQMLARAAEAIPNFIGFRFHHVPYNSPTVQALHQAADTLGLLICDEGELKAPQMDLASAGEAAVGKKSLVRHQRQFERAGKLAFVRHRDPDRILERLDDLFDQHVARWADTPYPSLFLDRTQRAFYRDLARNAAVEGWLRFTEVIWDAQPVAFHFGFHYRGEYLWYKPSFDIRFARRSPGEVLMRDLLFEAIEQGARVFDLGLGDEPFKRRFATQVRTVRTWGLYTHEAVAHTGESALEGGRER